MTVRRVAGVAVLLALTAAAGWRVAAHGALAAQGRPAPGTPSPGAPWSPVKLPGPEQHAPELNKAMENVRALVGLRVATDGVPDYRARAEQQRERLPVVRQQLEALRTDAWSVHERVDFLLLRAELNNLEFQLRVFRPTTRNPSFYVNEAIDNIGRHLTGGRYLRGDLMPYSKERALAILKALADTD
jgi:hypothetical protein